MDSFETDTEDAMPSSEEKVSSGTPSAKKLAPIMEVSTSSEKEWEVWGNASANMLSGTATNINVQAAAASTSATNSSLDYSIGIEKYFFNSNIMMNQLSLTGFFHSRNSKLGHDIQNTESLTEFGAGVRYHFYQSAMLINGIMPFALLDVGMGSVTLTNQVIGATSTTDTSVKGTSQFFAVGGGIKYILGMGLGFKAIVDYYSSSESYAYTATTGTRTLSGVRLQTGISYRF